MKKIFLTIALLLSSVIIFAQNKIEQKIEKDNGSYFVIDDDNIYKVDTTIITVKTNNFKYISENYLILRKNKLGYIDIKVPKYSNFATLLSTIECR